MNTPSAFAVVALSTAALLTSAQGSISLVAYQDTVTLSFATVPNLSEIATGYIDRNATPFQTITDIEGLVQSTSLDDITSALEVTNQYGQDSQLVKYHSTDGSLYFLPKSSGNSGVGASVMLATLQNDTNTNVISLQVSYDYSRVAGMVQETAPGLRAYYSFTGAANSWQLIAPFSVDTTASPSSPDHLSAEVPLNGPWAAGSLLYFMWADDNVKWDDNTYKMDNLSFTAVKEAIPIPEPTVVLLGGLSALALLRRRRD